MVNGLPLIVWVHDAAGNQVMVNDTFCEYFGVTREEMKGDRWQVLVHPDDVAAYREELSACLRERRPFHAEVRVERADGQWRWIESWGRPRVSASGELHGMVGTSADITDRRREQEARRLAAERDRLRTTLTDALRPLRCAEAIERETTRVLGEHLGASRVHYAEVSEDGEHALVRADYCRAGVPSVVGRHHLDSYGPTVMNEIRAGRTLVISDVQQDPRLTAAEKAATAALMIGAYVIVPLIKGGRTVAILVAHHLGPHAWTADEVELLQEVADRTWLAIERARAETALRRSEERYRTLLESIDQGFCVFEVLFDEHGQGIDHRFLETNPAFERHAGLVDAVGKTARELVPDLEACWPEIYGRVVLTGQPHHFVLRSEAMGRWFEVAASRVGEPEEHKVALLFTDISERKRAEDVLRASEGRLALALDTARAGAWEFDLPSGEFLWDERVAALLGVPAARAKELAQRWLDFVHPDDRSRVAAAWAAAIEGGRSYDVELRARRMDGAERWLLTRGVLVEEVDGHRRMLGVVQDITETKRIEEQLRESDRRKDDYLAMLGHELRNPLAAICSATELVKLTKTDDPRLARASAVLERQCAHMAGLIGGLLEVSRIARGKIVLERETLDLRDVVRAVIEDRSVPPGLDLRLEVPGEPVWASADRVRVAQVLDNLIANAIKFTAPPGVVRVALAEERGRVVIRVHDTGVGIRPERLARVFEPFHQEEQDVARDGGGLGLGLALAKGLVELHLGTIEARSAGLGRGTELVVYLPLAPAPARSERRAQGEGVASRRILIVEDNLDAADMLRYLLELRGHEVSVARTGSEGLEVLERRVIDLVLCDLGLPGMSGYELAAAVRARPALSHVPLVALTGYGQPEDRRRSAEVGFDEHLTKPITIDVLGEVLDRLAAARR